MATYKDLIAYKKAFSLTMDIFQISKFFPQDEKYSLTDPIRRSSRSVCANLAESYRKRRYKNHFISKLSDAETENTETEVWLDLALACHYISDEKHKELISKNDEVGKLISYMINNPEKFM